MTVCDWSAEAPLPDATSRPSVFVGKGLPTYEGLNQFTPAEGANHFRRACFVVRTRRKRSKRRHGCMTENRRWGLSLSKMPEFSAVAVKRRSLVRLGGIGGAFVQVIYRIQLGLQGPEPRLQ